MGIKLGFRARKAVMDREMTMEVLVGTFMFLILLVTAYFTIILTRESWFKKSYPLEVVFQNVMGLRKSDVVVVRGMTIGKVDALRLENDGVHVVCSVASPLALKTDARITVKETSVLGGRMLDIFEGSKAAPPYVLNKPVKGTEPFDLISEAAAIVHDIRKAVEEGKMMDNLSATLADVRQVTDRLSRGEGTVGKLLTDESVYNDLRQVSSDGKVLVAQLKDVTARISSGQGTLGKLLIDDSVYTNVAAAAANLKTISDRIAEGKGTLGRLLAEDDKLYRDLSDAVASVKDITGRMDRGEGLLGKLSKDETLYEEVKKAVSEARAAVDDFRETAPITTFSSILFGAF